MKSLKQLKKQRPIKKIRKEREENKGRYPDELIRDVRECLKGGKTYQEVGEKLGVPHQNVYRWGLKKNDANAIRRTIRKK